MTPEAAVRRALAEHELLRAAEAETDEARAVYRQVRSAWWPSVSSRASYTRLSSNIPSIGANLPGVDSMFTIAPIVLNRYHAEVNVEQPLFTGFERINRIRASRRRAEAAAEKVEQQRADVALDTRRAYWTLAGARSRAEALLTSLQHVEAHLEDIRNRMDAGAALEREVLAARTRLAEVRLDLVEAEHAVEAGRLELRLLAHVAADVPIAPDPETELPPVVNPAVSIEELAGEATDDHPALDALRWQVAALEAEASAARGQWLPEAYLTGRYVYARPNQYFFAEQDEFHGTWEAGVRLQWDIFSGGRRAAEAHRAEAQLRAAEARLEHRREQIQVEIARQYLKVRSTREAIDVARQAVREARETFDVVTDQYEAGAALASEVLEAEAALRSARARRAEVRSGYAIARAEFLHALGRVW